MNVNVNVNWDGGGGGGGTKGVPRARLPAAAILFSLYTCTEDGRRETVEVLMLVPWSGRVGPPCADERISLQNAG